VLEGARVSTTGFDGFVRRNTASSTRRSPRPTPAPTGCRSTSNYEAHSGRSVAAGQICRKTHRRPRARILRTMFRFGLFDHPEWWKAGTATTRTTRVARRAEQSGTSAAAQREAQCCRSARACAAIAVIGTAAERDHRRRQAEDFRSRSLDSRRAGAHRAGPGGGSAVRYDGRLGPARVGALARGRTSRGLRLRNRGEGVGPPVHGVWWSDRDRRPRPDGADPPWSPRQSWRTIGVLTTARPCDTAVGGAVAGGLRPGTPGARGRHALGRRAVRDADPSGRLPVTFLAKESDVASEHDRQWRGGEDLRALEPLQDRRFPPPAHVCRAKGSCIRGTIVGTRGYDDRRPSPRRSRVGLGLSYTRFDSRCGYGARPRGVPTAKMSGGRAGARTSAQLYVAVGRGPGERRGS